MSAQGAPAAANDPLDFDGQVVFVAGGTSGINLGTAQGFARAGACVAVLSRKQDKVDAAVDALAAHGNSAIGFAADVRDYDAVDAALQATRERLGAIDIVVSGAAGNFPAAAADMSPNAFRAVIEIDLLGTYHVLRSAFRHLNKPGARVVNILPDRCRNPGGRRLVPQRDGNRDAPPDAGQLKRHARDPGPDHGASASF